MPVDEMYGGKMRATGNEALISETWPSGFCNPITNLRLQSVKCLLKDIPMFDFDEICITVLCTSIK